MNTQSNPPTDTPPVRHDGPPIARAHAKLADALERATSGINMDRIEPTYQHELASLVARLRERGDDWEDEWPK